MTSEQMAAPERSKIVRWPVAAALAITAGATALGVGTALLAASHRIVLNYNEGWNAYNAAAAMGAGPLYPAPVTLAANNYPPLSFYIVGIVGRLLGDMIFAGRLIAILALIVTAWNIGRAARRIAISRGIEATAAGWISALLFTAAMGAYYFGYVGMNDPQMLAHALMTTALVSAMRDDRSWRHMAALCALMLAAGLVKHSLLAFPAALLMSLLIFDRVAAGRLLACGVAMGAAVAACLALAFGRPMLDSLLAPRTSSWTRGMKVTRDAMHGFGWLALPAAVWAPIAGRSRETWLVFIYLLTSLATGIVFARGYGVNYNIFFDFVIASAVLAGPAMVDALERIARWSRWPVQRALLLLPLVPLLALVPMTHVRLSALRSGLSPAGWAAETRATGEEIAVIRSRPGRGACEMLALCYWSGKEREFDALNAWQAVMAKQISRDDLLKPVLQTRYSVVQLLPGEAERRGPLGDFARAVAQRYRLAHHSASGDIFVLDSAAVATH